MNAAQRTQMLRKGFLVVDDVLSPGTVAALNERFERQLREEMPSGSLAWYLNREADTPGGEPRRLWHHDLIAPPAVEPILRELFSEVWGHLHPPTPYSKVGCFRLDHDNAHYIAPLAPDHIPNPATDFPPSDHHSHPSLSRWSPHGIIQDGFHGVSNFAVTL